jgi:hypothetical protein
MGHILGGDAFSLALFSRRVIFAGFQITKRPMPATSTQQEIEELGPVKVKARHSGMI